MTPDTLANSLGALAQAITDEVHGALAEVSGRSESDVAALVHLSKYKGEPIDALRRPLGLSHPGCVRLVDRLEHDRLVARSKGDDRRARVLDLTPAGVAEARAAHRRRLDTLRKALAALSARERESLAGIVENLIAALVKDEDHALVVCRLCDYRICADDACPVGRALA